MTPLQLALVLAAMGGGCILLLLLRKAWATTIGSVAAVIAAVLLIEWSAATPLPGPPPRPFVLWFAQGDFSWVSPDRDAAPRTYEWLPSPEMLRALREGVPLLVEDGDPEAQAQNEGRNDEIDVSGLVLRWTKLEPENAQKGQPQ